MEKTETSLFDGVDTSLSALAQFAGPHPPDALTAGIAAIANQAVRAQQAFDAGNDGGSRCAGRSRARQPFGLLRAQLGSLSTHEIPPAYEIDFRLNIKERDYQDAVLAAQGLTFDAVADDGLVIAGQPLKLSLLAVNRGASEVAVTNVAITRAWKHPARARRETVKKGIAVYTCAAEARTSRKTRS